MAAVVLLMGLPGCGKSTLCRRLLELPQDDVRLHHVCYDEVLEFDATANWREGRDQVLMQVEHVIIANRDPSLMILVDDNFYYQSMRRMYFKMAKRHRIPTCICSEDLAVDRVQQRGFEGGLEVDSKTIHQMAQRLEPPVQHNWEKFHLKINSEALWKSLLDMVASAREALISLDLYKDESVNENHQTSFLQDADVMLRKFISAKMQESKAQGAPKADMQQLAQQLNTLRKRFLSQHCNSSSPSDVVDQFRQFAEL